MKALIIIIAVTMLIVLGILFGAAKSTVHADSVSANVTYDKNISTITPGDANQDGKVDMGDVVKVEREILGYDLLTYGADANGDGRIDMGDVVTIERMILGLK